MWTAAFFCMARRECSTHVRDQKCISRLYFDIDLSSICIIIKYVIYVTTFDAFGVTLFQ